MCPGVSWRLNTDILTTSQRRVSSSLLWLQKHPPWHFYHLTWHSGFPQTACFYGCVTLQILRHFYIFLWTASNSRLLSPLQGKYWHPPVETWRLRPTETEQLGSACCGGKTTGSGIGSAQVQVPALQCSSSVVRHRAPISELLFSPWPNVNNSPALPDCMPFHHICGQRSWSGPPSAHKLSALLPREGDAEWKLETFGSVRGTESLMRSTFCTVGFFPLHNSVMFRNAILKRKGREESPRWMSAVTMDWSTPGFPVHQQPPEPTQTHVHCIGDAVQPSHPLLANTTCTKKSRRFTKVWTTVVSGRWDYGRFVFIALFFMDGFSFKNKKKKKKKSTHNGLKTYVWKLKL